MTAPKRIKATKVRARLVGEAGGYPWVVELDHIISEHSQDALTKALLQCPILTGENSIIELSKIGFKSQDGALLFYMAHA